MSDLWTLEWSKSQNAFHMQEASSTEEKNLNNLLNDQGHDYIVICVGSREKCDKQADRFRHYLQSRMIEDMNVGH